MLKEEVGAFCDCSFKSSPFAFVVSFGLVLFQELIAPFEEGHEARSEFLTESGVHLGRLSYFMEVFVSPLECFA